MAFCRSTDVHKVHSQGPVDRTVDLQRASALWKWPGRPDSRPLGHLPFYGRPVGWPLAVRSEIWPLAGRPTAESSAELSWTASFWSLFILGCFRLFSTWFEVGFQASFFYLSKCLSPLVFEPNTSISKGEFFKSVLKKRFLEFFTTKSIQVFLTHTWAFHCYIIPIGELWGCF